MSISVLITPLRLGAMQLPNRIVAAPLTRMRAGAGYAPTTLTLTLEFPPVEAAKA
jgi:N-ethylmaleimide reductase